jgi:hypothetical protein
VKQATGKLWRIDDGKLVLLPAFYTKREQWWAALKPLYHERSQLVIRKFDPDYDYTARDSKLQRHLEREIDWYEAQIYRPSHEYNRWQMRRAEAMIRKIQRKMGEE